MLKGILFDLDGTLVDSLKVAFDGFNHVFQTHGAAAKTPREIMAMFGPGERKIFAQVVGDANAEAASLAYANYTRSRMGESPLFPGIPELIAELSDRRIPMSIVTGRGRESTEIILKHHGIGEKFVKIICHEDVSSSKPSPEGIQLALQSMGLAPENTAYVGDMWMDVRAAHRAGCRAISAMWDSVYDHESVEKEKPHVFVETPRNLLAYLAAGLRK